MTGNTSRARPATMSAIRRRDVPAIVAYVMAILRFGRSEPAMFISFLVMSIAVIVAIFGPWIAPHSPLTGTLSSRLLPPAWMAGSKPEYLLGTDTFGRDVLSRLILGSQVSLSVSLLSIINCWHRWLRFGHCFRIQRGLAGRGFDEDG